MKNVDIDSGRKLIKPVKVKFGIYLLLWLIGIVCPLIFIKVGTSIYSEETYGVRTQTAINKCKQVMRNLTDNCSINSYILSYINRTERLLDLSNSNGSKLLNSSPNFEAMTAQKFVKRYMKMLKKKTPLKPYLLIASGKDFKDVDSCTNPKYFKFKKEGKYVVKNILKKLEKENKNLNSKRFKGMFANLFGRQETIALQPDKVNMIFTTKNNGDRIYIYYKFWHSLTTKKCMGGYLIAFSEKDIRATNILKRAVRIARCSSQVKIVVKKARKSPQPFVDDNRVHTFCPVPFNLMKVNVYSGNDLARKFFKRTKLKTNLKKVENAVLCSYPFFAISMPIAPEYSENFKTFSGLLSLLVSFFSLFLIKNITNKSRFNFSIQHKLLLSFITASILPMALMTYAAIKYSNSSIENELYNSSKEIESYQNKLELEVLKFENNQTLKVYDLLTDLSKVVNKSKQDIDDVILKYLNGGLTGILYFRTDGLFIQRVKNEFKNLELIKQFFLNICVKSFGILNYDSKSIRNKLIKQKLLNPSFSKLISDEDVGSYLKSRGRIFNIKIGKIGNLRTVSYSRFPKDNNGNGYFLTVLQNYNVLAGTFLKERNFSEDRKALSQLPGEVDNSYFIVNKNSSGEINLRLPKFSDTSVDPRVRELASHFLSGKIDDLIIRKKSNIRHIYRIRSFGKFPLIVVTHFAATKIPIIKFMHRQFLIFLYIYIFAILALITKTITIEFVRPIELLINGVKWLGNGIFPQIYTKLTNELATIVSIFNDMVKGLKERNLLERFVSSEATKAITEEGRKNQHIAGKKVERTILFLHVKDFKNLVGKLEPEELIELLNTYFREVELIVTRNNGSIDKYIGDAVMAIFESENKACISAIEIADNITHINNLLKKRKLVPINIGIGLAGGKVISGRVGARGSRMDFTVVGDRVNLAARLEALSRSKDELRIMVSEEVFIPTKNEFKFTPFGKVRVKGKTEEVMAYILETS